MLGSKPTNMFLEVVQIDGITLIKLFFGNIHAWELPVMELWI